MTVQPVLIAGRWQASDSTSSFTATDPSTGGELAPAYPVSSWNDCDRALEAAAEAADALRSADPGVAAAFLERYAERIEGSAAEICSAAHQETALPIEPRLRQVELPRTVYQLRQAAAASREESWRQPTIDVSGDIRSCLAPIGPVLVLGPNNFPLAYNGISGGDFASAVAAGNPVIAKGHPAHPRTTQLLAEQAHEAARAVGLPAAAVQLLYHVDPQDGERMVADRRLGAVGFTGSRAGGLRLKACADRAGTPIYLEMSSVNPVFFLPGAMSARCSELVAETAASCLMASGQFCTSPNLLVLPAGDAAERFIAELSALFGDRAPQSLLTAGVLESLRRTVTSLQAAGATLVTGGKVVERDGYVHENTLLRVDGRRFLEAPERLQTEAFGNATLAVVTADLAETVAVARRVEGSLTGSIYSAAGGEDDAAYEQVAAALRPRVGRLLNDKMPTGVVVSPAMNHGGPYPATGHPGFTAVGFPAAMRRFAMLQCFDHVRESRLPPCLRDQPPHEQTWRLIDGTWRRGSISSPKPGRP